MLGSSVRATTTSNLRFAAHERTRGTDTRPPPAARGSSVRRARVEPARGRPEPQDGLETVRVDVTDPDSIIRARDEVLDAHPDLDVVVTMSGVMLVEDLRDPAHIAATETTIDTNLLGTIRVIDTFTPHLIAGGSEPSSR